MCLNKMKFERGFDARQFEFFSFPFRKAAARHLLCEWKKGEHLMAKLKYIWNKCVESGPDSGFAKPSQFAIRVFATRGSTARFIFYEVHLRGLWSGMNRRCSNN